MHQPESDLNSIVSCIALHNDEQAYRRLFDLLYNRLKCFAASILKSNELAEEVACDTMFTLWCNRAQLPGIANIKVYAYVIAKNKALNLLKRDARSFINYVDEMDVNISFHDLTPEQILITEELKRNIEQVVNALPPKCKLIFRFIKEDGLSYKEVAELLDISVKTVDAQLVTAIKRIGAVVKREYNLTR
ncbi:sigma-70 family RNA polymerase sigma factor [Mucilaginibacter robiniae]|uniref:Sigma-70 family RNA polymerase sigma factor n=1 Tax=Mucilaginibacter robiniae TaxID=2728022 RepID=A0A7L5EBY5_9SPHI|nr:sigma-70 family RNA polymerase sigma factor [Mucilaginibacter robiniae]QJD97926.1 sigma-70 family RNA polymerase sigma factor [Mucilaginibacter robiniae]